MDAPLNSPEARDIAYALHPYTNLKQHEAEGPLVITEGKGVNVYDTEGREYIEAVAGLWCASLGFSETSLAEVAAEQIRKLPFYHMFAAKSHEPAIELSERLIRMFPVPMSKAFFNNSGSEANDTAIKIVWYYNNALGRPRKKKIIAQIKGYHGVTVATASLTGLPRNHADFDLPIANIRHSECPHYWRYGKPGEREEEFATRTAEALEALILREGPETVAAFIAEPVQGAGGVIVPPRTYFEKVQAVLKKYDVLFLVDEVICGFGRTGNMFGTETFALKPDIVSMAKALSASYLPISATLINEKVYEVIRDNSDKHGAFAHGYTYSGHPVCAAVAVATLKIYEERDTIGHVRRVAPRFQERLKALGDHPLVGEARGVGLIGAVELVKDKASKQPFVVKGGSGGVLQKVAQRHGLIVRGIADAVGLSPPLIITEAEIDTMFDRLERTLDDTAKVLHAG